MVVGDSAREAADRLQLLGPEKRFASLVLLDPASFSLVTLAKPSS